MVGCSEFREMEMIFASGSGMARRCLPGLWRRPALAGDSLLPWANRQTFESPGATVHPERRRPPYRNSYAADGGKRSDTHGSDERGNVRIFMEVTTSPAPWRVEGQA